MTLEGQEAAGIFRDKRYHPAGSCPVTIQMWLMVGIAVVILGIILPLTATLSRHQNAGSRTIRPA